MTSIRQTDRQIDRQTDIHTYMYIYIYAYNIYAYNIYIYIYAYSIHFNILNVLQLMSLVTVGLINHYLMVSGG